MSKINTKYKKGPNKSNSILLDDKETKIEQILSLPDESIEELMDCDFWQEMIKTGSLNAPILAPTGNSTIATPPVELTNIKHKVSMNPGLDGSLPQATPIRTTSQEICNINHSVSALITEPINIVNSAVKNPPSPGGEEVAKILQQNEITTVKQKTVTELSTTKLPKPRGKIDYQNVKSNHTQYNNLIFHCFTAETKDAPRRKSGRGKGRKFTASTGSPATPPTVVPLVDGNITYMSVQSVRRLSHNKYVTPPVLPQVLTNQVNLKKN